MITISLVITNKKGEVLICKKDDSSCFEFPNVVLIGGICLHDCVSSFGQSSLGVNLSAGSCLEIVYQKNSVNPLFNGALRETSTSAWTSETLVDAIHVIIEAEITNGCVSKGYYSNLYWKKICELEMDFFQLFGRQVLDKIKTCEYCRYIHDEKDTLDSYFNAVLDRWSEARKIADLLIDHMPDSDVYTMAYNSISTHLRAFFIENEKLQKNITVQNYLRLYKRDDLATCFDDFFDIQVRPGLSLRKLIRETVDKYIVHYDRPSNSSDELYSLCKSVFATNGTLPLQELIVYLDYLFCFSTMDMWYFAGELGIRMDNLVHKKRLITLMECKRVINECRERFQPVQEVVAL